MSDDLLESFIVKEVFAGIAEGQVLEAHDEEILGEMIDHVSGFISEKEDKFVTLVNMTRACTLILRSATEQMSDEVFDTLDVLDFFNSIGVSDFPNTPKKLAALVCDAIVSEISDTNKAITIESAPSNKH